MLGPVPVPAHVLHDLVHKGGGGVGDCRESFTALVAAAAAQGHGSLTRDED